MPHSDAELRAVIFDFGGVLVDWNPRHLYRRLFNGDEKAMELFLEEIHFTERSWKGLGCCGWAPMPAGESRANCQLSTGKGELLRRQVNGQVALVVDDLASRQPWRPRGIKIHSRADIVERKHGYVGAGAYIRVTPARKWSWGVA
jgi:hypothetical protein